MYEHSYIYLAYVIYTCKIFMYFIHTANICIKHTHIQSSDVLENNPVNRATICNISTILIPNFSYYKNTTASFDI